MADCGGERHAYDPMNLTHEFWNSNMNSSRDGLPGEVEYATPPPLTGYDIAERLGTHKSDTLTETGQFWQSTPYETTILAISK